jgi:hypothetical protein
VRGHAILGFVTVFLTGCDHPGSAECPSVCGPPEEAGTAIDGGQADAHDEAAASDATCVPDGGVYTCLGGSWPVCPATAQPEQPCDYSVPPCMGCTNGGATVGSGYTCACQDAGLVPDQDAALWGCIGTEYTCR